MKEKDSRWVGMLIGLFSGFIFDLVNCIATLKTPQCSQLQTFMGMTNCTGCQIQGYLILGAVVGFIIGYIANKLCNNKAENKQECEIKNTKRDMK